MTFSVSEHHKGISLKPFLLDKLRNISGMYAARYYPFGAAPLAKPDVSMAPLLLVGKEHSFELSRELPIGRVTEAVKAAKMMEDVAPFDGKRFYLVQAIDENRCLVTFSTIKPDVYAKLSKSAWLVLPETLVVKHALTLSDPGKQEGDMFGLPGRHLQVVNQGTNFRCQAYQNAQADDDSDVYPKMLLQALGNLPGHLLLQAVNVDRLRGWAYGVPWRQGALLFAGVMTIYMGLSSLWLGYREHQLQTEITNQRQELDDVFKLQNALESLQQSRQQWVGNDRLQQALSPLWVVLLELVNTNVELLSFTFDDSGFILRGRADKATDAISFLASRPEITLPESVSPVVNSRGKEIFSVKFMLKGQ